MKNKKGMLLAEETLKTVIAIIVIGFLLYFLVSLYFANVDKQKREQAEASLQYLIGQINLEVEEIQIYNPEGWAILSWPYSDEGKLPNFCSDKKWESCICISDTVGFTGATKALFTDETIKSQYLEKSDENGVCIENPQKFVVKEDGIDQLPIGIGKPFLELNIDYESKIISKK